MADRVQVQVRMPKALKAKIEASYKRRQRVLGASTWSKNDEILALLEAALRESPRD
jgi:hypothetical protein